MAILQGERMKKINGFFPKNKLFAVTFDYGTLLIGCLIIALSFNTLLLPNKLASGGLVGLSILTKALFAWNPAYVQWLINLPIFIVGMVFLGSKSTVKSIVGTIGLPLFILLFQSMSPLTLNPLLAALYGGLGLGLGLGLVFRSKGSTGGFSILVLIIQRYSSITMGTITMIMDGLVIIIAGFVFSPENALYALIVVFIMSKTIDFIQLGFNLSKVFLVFTDYQDEITAEVLKLQRGITKIHTTGGYLNKKKTVLMIVINRSEVTIIKHLIHRVDPSAFFIISNAHEVIGDGFSRERSTST